MAMRSILSLCSINIIGWRVASALLSSLSVAVRTDPHIGVSIQHEYSCILFRFRFRHRGADFVKKKGTNMQANTLLTELHPPSLGSRLSKCSFHPDTRPGLLDWLPLPRLPADLRIDSRAPSLVFVNSFLADKNSAHIRLIELIYPCCGVAAFRFRGRRLLYLGCLCIK